MLNQQNRSEVMYQRYMYQFYLQIISNPNMDYNTLNSLFKNTIMNIRSLEQNGVILTGAPTLSETDTQLLRDPRNFFTVMNRNTYPFSMNAFMPEVVQFYNGK